MNFGMELRCCTTLCLAGMSERPKPGRSNETARNPALAKGPRLRTNTSAELPSEAPNGAPIRQCIGAESLLHGPIPAAFRCVRSRRGGVIETSRQRQEAQLLLQQRIVEIAVNDLR